MIQRLFLVAEVSRETYPRDYRVREVHLAVDEIRYSLRNETPTELGSGAWLPEVGSGVLLSIFRNPTSALGTCNRRGVQKCCSRGAWKFHQWT